MTDTCKHNWQFTDHGTGTLKCTRCGTVTGPKPYEERVKDFLQEPWTTEQVTVPNGAVYKFHDPRPSSITFFGMKDNANIEVMRLSRDGVWVNPDIPTDEAAKKVLEVMDSNLKLMVDKERERELDACCDLLEGMHIATDGNHNYYLYAAVELRKLRSKK